MDSRRLEQMASERIRLSYVDPIRCIKLLELYGVKVTDGKQAIDPESLPVVVLLPETSFHDTIPDHEKIFPRTETDQ